MEPTKAAMRAAAFLWDHGFIVGRENGEVAGVIDRETGLSELIEAADRLLDNSECNCQHYEKPQLCLVCQLEDALVKAKGES